MQFGPYELKHRLGAGGMGEVYLASQTLSQGVRRRVVIKRMLPHLSSDARFAETFVQEAAILAQLNHPNIATLFDFGEQNGQFYLAIEFLDGLDLYALLAAANRPAPLAVALRIGVDVAAALHHAHDATDDEGRPLNVIHRDVTPSNIFLTSNGRVKVLDFGVAKSSGTSHKTTTGVLKGKYSFFAPEQVRAQPFDRRVDIFALGLVLYEALTRQHPFRREGEFQTLNAIVSEEAPPVSQAGAPSWLDPVLARALAKNPDERYPTMQAFGAEISRAAAQAGVTLADDAEVARWVTSVKPAGEPSLAESDRRGTQRTPGGAQTVEASAERTIDDTVRSATVSPPPGSNDARPRATPWFVPVAVLATGITTAIVWSMTDRPAPRSVTNANSADAAVVIAPASVPTAIVASAPAIAMGVTKETPVKAAPAQSKGRGRLKLVLPDWGATLYIDGAEVDDGPPWKDAEGVSLAAGTHSVRLVNTALGIDARLAIKIAPGQSKVLTIPRAGAAKK